MEDKEPECIEHDTCQGAKHWDKPPHLRRTPTDFYYPRWCEYCNSYRTKPVIEITEKRTIYTENLTDGKFLKLQATVHTLQEKVNQLQSSKVKQYKYD